MLDVFPKWVLMIFGAVNLLGTFWVFSYVTRSVAKSVIGKELYEKLENDPRDEKRAAARQVEMEATFDTWHQPLVADLKPEIANSCLADRNGEPFGRILGSMSLEVTTGSIRILDCQLGRKQAVASTHTALVMTPKDVPSNVPEFYLRPNGLPYNFHKFLQRYETVDGLGWHDYILESQDIAYKTRELFETHRDENAGLFIEYVRSRRWTAEWSSGRLVVYEFDQYVAPDKITQVAAEVVTHYELLLETVQLVDQHLINKINQTAARLETTKT